MTIMTIHDIENYVHTRELTREKYLELKEEQKDRAKKIRYLKTHRKLDKIEETGLPLWQLHVNVGALSWEYRVKHIVYCLFRGRKYSEIEQYSHIHDKEQYFNWRYLLKHVEKVIKEYSVEKTITEEV